MAKPEADQLQASLAEILTWVKATADKTGNFVTEQAPLVAQEIVAYGRAKHTIIIAIALLFFLASAIAVPFMVRAFKKQKSEDGKAAVAFCYGVPMFIACMFGMLMFGDNITLCIKAWFAPRLYVIEYVAELLK